MSEWPLRKLGDIATVTAGTSAPQGDKYFEEGRFNFVRTQDVGRCKFTTSLTESKDRVNELAVKEKRLKLARKGTSVFPKSGASILTNSRAMLGVDSYVVSHLAIVDPNQQLLDDYYLHYFLRTIDFGELAQSEEGYPSLRLSEISEVEIPTPPLEEQRRIVARIEELTHRAEEMRKLRKETAEKVSTLVPAVIQSIIEEGQGFVEASIGDICSMKTGKTPPTTQAEYFDGDILFVCPSDVGGSLKISKTERHLTRQAITDGKANLLKRGTVLLVGIGSTVGKVGIAERDLCTNQQITGLIFNTLVLPAFAAWYLSTQRNVIRNAAAGGGVPIINQKGISQLKLRYPKSIDEQQAIVLRLEALQAKVDRITAEQNSVDEDLHSFHPALLAKAFRGEL